MRPIFDLIPGSLSEDILGQTTNRPVLSPFKILLGSGLETISMHVVCQSVKWTKMHKKTHNKILARKKWKFCFTCCSFFKEWYKHYSMSSNFFRKMMSPVTNKIFICTLLLWTIYICAQVLLLLFVIFFHLLYASFNCLVKVRNEWMKVLFP